MISSFVEVPSSEGIPEYEQTYVHFEITKRHWLSNDAHSSCMSKTCGRKFSLLERQHHCRMCGKIFCSDCLTFRKKLNYLANPDPQGKLYKVCGTCYVFGKDDAVTTRSLMNMFVKLKHAVRLESVNSVERQSGLTKTWRDKLRLEAECERLVAGFQNCFGKSEMKRSLQELKTVLSTPEWQKSSVWLQESMADKCQGCSRGFGLLQKKYTCKLCGQCRCKTCCYRELLVYMPDNAQDNGNCIAKLAIIKVIGSPEVEPEVSLLLHACDKCREFVSQRQISQIEREQEEEDADKEVMVKLLKVNKAATTLQSQIISQLTKMTVIHSIYSGFKHLAFVHEFKAPDKFQEVVESLDGPSATQSSGPQSNVRLLAKAQTDIADNLASFYLKVQVVKSLMPLAETAGQKKLFQNYLKSKCEFYLSNTVTYRQVKWKLNENELINPELLSRIQAMVDQSAIISAQVYIRQLVFETIALCSKYNLSDIIPSLLTTLDTVIEEEACQCLTSAGEDWNQHSDNVKVIVKAQMKDRRMIRLSRRVTAVEAHRHAADIMLKRSASLVQQVKVQLEMKTIKRSFPQTKVELEVAGSQLEKLAAKDLLKK